MDLSSGSLMASLFVSSIGMGIFVFGKREARVPQIAVGLTLMGFPYFVTDPTMMLGIAAVLVVGLVAALRSGL